VWKAARVDEGFDLAAWKDCPADALLLDGPAALLYGGAGRTFDWRIARAGGRKIILAGGLDAANVGEAIEQARPWGVDACSRIESAPGKKDHRKMTQFIESARAAFAARAAFPC
jgi:phosphoribosylanthranilate isomerase